MSYAGMVEIATSQTLMDRVTAAAAAESIDSPGFWASNHMWELAAQPGWADAWEYATQTATEDNNPDTGARPGVVSDQMILAAVQALKAAEASQG